MNKIKSGIAMVLMLAIVLLLVPQYTATQDVEAYEASPTVQRQFINAIAGSAVSIARSHGLFPSVMIAQAILESDWGRSKLSQPPYHNLFGIKGGSDGVIFDTLEDDGTGNYYGIRDSFRRYNSYLESLRDYAELFRSTPHLTRVYAPFVNSTTVEEACAALTGTYATDTSYGRKLMNIIIGYNLLVFDGAVNRAPSWEIKPKNDIVYSHFNSVNIRQDHNTSSPILMRAMAGDAFRRLGVTTGWTMIQVEDGRKAYIASEYVSPEKPTDIYEPEKDGYLSRSAPKDSDVATNPSSLANSNGENTNNGNQAAKDNKNNPPAEPKNSPPPEPKNGAQDPAKAKHTEAEVKAAKAAADKAIAEGPSSATKSGVLDSRTAGIKQETKVDKTKLESLLGSNVNLPFASEDVKKEYVKTMKKAVALYWNPKATQKDIDKTVAELNKLRERAEQEDADGLKADNEQLRELVDKNTGVKLVYTKLAIDKTPIFKVEKNRHLSLSSVNRQFLRSRGQRWITYQLELCEDEQAEAAIAAKRAAEAAEAAAQVRAAKRQAPLPTTAAPAPTSAKQGKANNVEVGDKANKALTLKSEIRLRLPIDKGFKESNIEVYHLVNDSLEKLNVKAANNGVVLQTSELGTYLLVERNVRLAEIKENNVVAAVSGDDLGVVSAPHLKRLYGFELITIILVLALGALARYTYRRFAAEDKGP